MVRIESVELRLKELDEVIQELSKYKDSKIEELLRDLSKRWIIERGLIARERRSSAPSPHIGSPRTEIRKDIILIV